MTPKEREALIAKAYSQIAEAQIALKLAELSLERIAAAEALPSGKVLYAGSVLNSELCIYVDPANVTKGTD